MAERKLENDSTASEPALSEDYSRVFDELIFRSLEPISLGVFILYTLFVIMGFFDNHTAEQRLALVSTDAAAGLVFLSLFVAGRRGMLRARWINAITLGLACICTGNVLLAFELKQDPFYLIYLPMIIICYGALLLSLRWLLVNAVVVIGGTALFAAGDLPLELRFRYFPALIGAMILATIILIVRRRGIIAAQRALSAARSELETRLEVEAQLAHAQRLDSLGKLVSGIAHEFNNLLMIIIGYADQLVAGARPNTPEAKDLRAIRDAGERAAALSRKLLAFSRQQVMKTQLVAANDVVRNARSLIERSLTGDIALRFDLDPDAGHISVDTLQMEQVLLNLALNARDAMLQGGGELRISTVPLAGDEQVEILVADSGEGMSADVRKRAFEPLFTTKQQGRGTGLGLATVYGTVTQSGGSIEIESAPGDGAKFRIRLPRVDAPVAAESSAVATDGRPALSLTGTVLVVDDEPEVRNVVCKTLVHYGCRVVEADGGAAAIEAASTHAFDVILTDIVMPSMSGIELVAELRRMGFTQRVIYMSGHGAGAEAQAVADGPLLRKPFRSDTLVRAVGDVLALPKS